MHCNSQSAIGKHSGVFIPHPLKVPAFHACSNKGGKAKYELS